MVHSKDTVIRESIENKNGLINISIEGQGIVYNR